MKIRNAIIAKLTIKKKSICTRRKRWKNNLQKTSPKTYSTISYLPQKRHTKIMTENMYRGFWCHVTYDKLGRKYDKPQEH